jgi:hypothetical protein
VKVIKDMDRKLRMTTATPANQERSLASSPENRCSCLLFLTAVAIAFRGPTSTTSFLPRVVPV